MQFAKHWAAALDDYAIDLAWSPDGTLLAAVSAAGGITLFDAATDAVKYKLAGHPDGANCLAWMPGGTGLATGGQDGCVRFWDAVTGAQTAEVALGNAWVEHLAWSAVGPRFLFAAAGRKLVALATDGTLAHTFTDAPKTISALALAPASSLQPSTSAIAAACFGHVVVWDATTFAVQKEFPYGNAIYALVWSPDGRWLVAGCHDNAVHL
ncbi:MAG TPA: WD40 repeat domain-containing protein, partial [Lacunisphaera sp.]